MKTLIAIIATVLSSGAAWATDPSELLVRVLPDSVAYVYETSGPATPKSLYSVVLQNIAFINQSKEKVILQEGSIVASRLGKPIHSKVISHPVLVTSAAKYFSYQQHGILQLYDFQFQTVKLLRGATLAKTDTLQPGQAVIVSHEVLLFDELPNELTININAAAVSGHRVSACTSIKVVNHTSQNKYTFPLKGRWMAAAAPSFTAHHRWASVQEFAFDFIKIGDDLLTFKGTGAKLEDYYAYGEAVYAVADGEVVAVSDGLAEGTDNLKRPDEKEEEYFTRVAANQQRLLMKGPKNIYGNMVVIRHANQEYSVYLHLRNGSVMVKKGEMVRQGQPIAQLGHSGNSTEPHLHFHLSNGSDILYSRSLPITFSNIHLFPDDNGLIRHIHSGQILSTDR